MARIRKSEGLIDWLDQRIAIKAVTKVLLTEYWIPKNINFLWAMGVVLTVLFMILLISGVFLLMYYKPDIHLAYDSVNYTIMQEVKYGWLWRHLHAVGASLVFLVIYIHMFVGIYYGSYKQGREMIWIGGMILFVLFSAEAFSGYMLPWGQMSYWAAAVITNLFGGIPVIGTDLVIWIRGNFTVADATLTRFFMLHVLLLPMLILVFIAIHFFTLRFPHVNNQKGEELDFDIEAKKYLEGDKKSSKVIPFWPVFLSKDIFVVCVFMVGYFFLTFYHYDFAMDPINFEPADAMKTPLHIYPEWYFLWSYEVLRGFFFSSDLGFLAFMVANVIFILLPFLDRSEVVAPAHERKGFRVWFWLLIADMMLLTLYGKLPPTGINAYIGFMASIIFLALFVALPIITKREKTGGVA